MSFEVLYLQSLKQRFCAWICHRVVTAAAVPPLVREASPVEGSIALSAAKKKNNVSKHFDGNSLRCVTDSDEPVYKMDADRNANDRADRSTGRRFDMPRLRRRAQLDAARYQRESCVKVLFFAKVKTRAPPMAPDA